MSLQGADIVCLSTHYWSERRFRKQEFMDRFAERNRVLFVEPSYSLARKPDPHLRSIATNRAGRGAVEQVHDQLWLYKPPRGLPYWTHPTVERANYRWYAWLLRRAMRRLGFQRAILWAYRPAYYHGLDLIPHERLVFDLVDDLVGYEDPGSPRVATVEACVTGLARQSDLLVVTSKPLEERYGSTARVVAHVANGFDGRRFEPVSGEAEPEVLATVPGPRIGFVGTLFGFLDFKLFEAVADAFPNASLVLVGPVEPPVAREMDRLVKRPNVHHLGAQPQAMIPALVRRFDVCINPFRTGRVTDSISPLKVYEYLAVGKPVVSVPMRSLQAEDAGRLVAFADTPEEFCQHVSAALENPGGDAAQRERQMVAAEHTWDRLFARLDEVCSRTLRG